MENQLLFDSIPFKRVKELINNDETKIISLEQSYNSYGQFYFLHLEINNEQFMFYGLGFHEYRNRYYVNTLKFDKVQTCLIKSEYKPLDKKDIISQLDKLKIKFQKLADSFKEEPDREFEMIADIADDDYAISNYF